MKLCPTKFHANTKQIYGFDIETYDKNKKFLMASIYGDNFVKVFYNKRDTIDFLKQKRFMNSIISATNLQFDFFGTFFNQPEELKWKLLWRGSNLLYAKSYIHNREFDSKYKQKGNTDITFIDTMNYAQFSVDKLGKILDIPKLKTPAFIGHKPNSKAEWEEMTTYNIRDSQISQKIIKFFFSAFSDLGATPKLTIASTAMSLYKNRFLKETYNQISSFDLLEQFQGYYGGNTHAYSRGKIEDYYYYDFNSLYPSVMRNEYPDPNSMRITHKNTLWYIENYQGLSKVSVYCPYMKYPLLPYRHKDKSEQKLLFPVGNFTGWYTHAELNEALRLGYIIKKVHKTYYYLDECLPFRDYVEELYNLRLQYKKEGNAMELVVKLLMNSLYGKFGQKFLDRDNWEVFNHTIEQLNSLKSFERIGNYIMTKKDAKPAAFCIPIWAIYTTAYARLKLHEYMLKADPVYVDTDSLITKKKFASSDKLGKLKLELYINNGMIVKPKFYTITGPQGDKLVHFCKIKGLGVKVDKKLFYKFIKDPQMVYNKFMKFKESLRRKMTPNEIIEMKKCMDLEDNKRLWQHKFDFTFEESKPLEIVNYDHLLTDRIITKQ